MNPKVLILGSAGQAGHQVYYYLKSHSNYNLIDISYSRKLNEKTILLDARNDDNFFKQVRKIKPQFIINCIGVLINGSDDDPKGAIILNALFPHKLVNLANEIDAKLIHISTDCVFSGKKITPYIETDEKDGVSIYAKTKSLGEVIDSNHLTIRTSIIGPEIYQSTGGFFDWFMNQSGAINGWSKSIWSGVTTLELAKSVKWFIENNTTGLYHLTNGNTISKYELLKLFSKHTNKKIKINKVDGVISDKSFIDTRQEIDYKLPSYEKMIIEMVELTESNKNLYKNYYL